MTWLARDTTLAHDVILKSYSFEGVHADRLEPIAAQVQQRARLRHPALMTPIDVLAVDGILVVVTSLLPNVVLLFRGLDWL
jgi:hypothetical protein